MSYQCVGFKILKEPSICMCNAIDMQCNNQDGDDNTGDDDNAGDDGNAGDDSGAGDDGEDDL